MEERIRLTYRITLPQRDYENGFRQLQISWNKYQASLAKLKRMPILGNLENLFPEDGKTVIYTLNNGVGCYNERSGMIFIQANGRRRANLCAKEIGLPVLI